ncbi:DUF4468 domain-containing protein [Flavobacterium sp. 3-210]
MTKIITLAFVMICSIVFSQDTEFKMSKEGFTDYVVTPCEGKTQSEIYKKTLDWINVTYKNPKEVLKANLENDYVRFEGSASGLVCVNALGMKNCYNTKYQIEVSFKEGKYKFDIIEIQYYVSSSQYSSGGWYPFNMIGMEPYYNKKGEIRSAYKYYPEYIPPYFNDLNKSLQNFVLSNEIPSKKADW